MKIDAEVVRLTPQEERARVEALAKRTAERELRLKTIRFQQFVSLKAEFDNLPEDEIDQLHTRVKLLADAERGAQLVGGGLVLGFRRLANDAMAQIRRWAEVMPWRQVKRRAIHAGLAALLVFGGSLGYEIIDKDGNTKASGTMEVNVVTTVGLNYVLDAGFHAGTPVTVWYLGLVQGSSTPTFAAADTMGSHAGWTEYTAYSQTNRVAWDETAAASGSTTSSTTSDFSMNATGTVAGGFLTSVATKSGTTGTLWMTASFSGGNQSVSNGDTLKLTYTLSTTAS